MTQGVALGCYVPALRAERIMKNEMAVMGRRGLKTKRLP